MVGLLSAHLILQQVATNLSLYMTTTATVYLPVNILLQMPFKSLGLENGVVTVYAPLMKTVLAMIVFFRKKSQTIILMMTVMV